MRKVIQFNQIVRSGFIELYALCDDGTMWHLVDVDTDRTEWQEVTPLPVD